MLHPATLFSIKNGRLKKRFGVSTFNGLISQNGQSKTMMLKLTVKDILRQKSYGSIAIISGFLLGVVYYFLTLSSAVNHNLIALVISPQYLAASVGLTCIVAILGGINIALVVYNIKTQRMNLQKGGSSAIFGGALAAFTPGCPACTTSLTAVLGIVGGLAIFPLQGLELKFVSIAALSFSIWWAMRNINKASCCTMEKID